MTEQQEAAADQQPFADSDSSGELALHNEPGLVPYSPPPGAPLQPADFLDQHVNMLAKAWRIADVVCQTPAAPAQYRGKPKEGTVAILYGAEVGLPPMAALQKVINIHGNPSLEARTMKGLLKAKGYKFRTVIKGDTEFKIEAWEPDSDRRNDPPDEMAHWTIERARQAEYAPRADPNTKSGWVERAKRDGTTVVDGNMKYVTDPTGMLEAKGTAEVCRSIAPEILLGLPYCAEERDDWYSPDDEDAALKPRQRGARAGGVKGLRDRAKAAAEAAEQVGREEPQDAEVVVEHEEEPPLRPHLNEEEAKATDNAFADELADEAPRAPEPEPTPEPATPTAEELQAEADAARAALEQHAEELHPGSKPEPTAAEPPAEPAPAPAQPPSDGDDLAMTPNVRSKGLDMLRALLINGAVTDPVEQLDAVAEVVAKREGGAYRKLTNVDKLTNRELKHVVDELRARKVAGAQKLKDYLGEAVNASALREAGLLEEAGNNGG